MSFGRYVAKLADAKGFDSRSTPVLQEVGHAAVLANVKTFVEGFLLENNPTGVGFVLDGLRHVEVLDEIAAQMEVSWKGLIFLSVDEEVRARRLAARNLGSVGVKGHPVEAQLPVLERMADFRLNTTALTADQCTDRIVGWLRGISEQIA